MPSAAPPSLTASVFDRIEMQPDGQASPFASALFADGASGLLFLLMVISGARFFTHRRRAAAAALAEHPGFRLPALPEAGGAALPCILHGRVTSVAGLAAAAFPVAIEIDQQGRETRRNVRPVQHRWREVGRRVFAKPFLLQLADGSSVRVEPDPRVLLVATLEGSQRSGLATRTRHLRLAEGQLAHVAGDLSRLPRLEGGSPGSDGATLVMRAGHRGRMLISTDSETKRQHALFQLHRRRSFGFLIALVVVHAAILADYDELRFAGRVVAARVTNHGGQKRRDANHRTAYTDETVLEASYSDEAGRAHPIAAEVSYALWNATWNKAAFETVPFLVSSRSSLVQIGTRPTTTPFRLFWMVLIAFTLSLTYVRSILAAIPWAAGRSLNESGPGRLDGRMT